MLSCFLCIAYTKRTLTRWLLSGFSDVSFEYSFKSSGFPLSCLFKTLSITILNFISPFSEFLRFNLEFQFRQEILNVKNVHENWVAEELERKRKQDSMCSESRLVSSLRTEQRHPLRSKVSWRFIARHSFHALMQTALSFIDPQSRSTPSGDSNPCTLERGKNCVLRQSV